MEVKYYLKDKSDKALIYAVVNYEKKRLKISTTLLVDSKCWDNEEQRCFTSSKFTQALNRHNNKVNKLLDSISNNFNNYTNRLPDTPYYTDPCTIKKYLNTSIEKALGVLKEEQKKMDTKPLEYFENYVDNMTNMVDKHTGRLISVRTQAHHRIVLKRFVSFFNYTRKANKWDVFDMSFEGDFEAWAYKIMKYSNNTIPASFSVLKVWLNHAVEEGYTQYGAWRHYRSKGNSVDNIYLSESEIKKIYDLDIHGLKDDGLIDQKSDIEITRDLFVCDCWTGLRFSDLKRLNEAVFDFKSNTVSILTEKTKKRVEIPIHPMLRSIYDKYNGVFPKPRDKAAALKHLKELGRLAGIDDDVIIAVNRAGFTIQERHKKYELIVNHTARRSFATNLYLKGVPTISIMQLTGHTTEANFLKYIKINERENAQMLQCFFK